MHVHVCMEECFPKMGSRMHMPRNMKEEAASQCQNIRMRMKHPHLNRIILLSIAQFHVVYRIGESFPFSRSFIRYSVIFWFLELGPIPASSICHLGLRHEWYHPKTVSAGQDRDNFLISGAWHSGTSHIGLSWLPQVCVFLRESFLII